MVGEILLLLVDDEPIVRMATQDALEGGGYAIVGASSGPEAMNVIEERRQEFSGLVTDIRLGEGPNGWELAQRARELNPLIPVVYITADSADQWAAYGVPKSAILQKPFAEAQLITAISTLMNEAAANISPPSESPHE